MIQLVLFTLDEQRYALYLRTVERVVRVVEMTHLPQMPAIVLGVVNVQGRIVPVINVRRRFGLPERSVNLDDQLLIARTAQRTVALLVDRVTAVLERPDKAVIAGENILPGMAYIKGVVKLEDGLVLIHDLDRFLSLEEQEVLDSAMLEQAHVQTTVPDEKKE